MFTKLNKVIATTAVICFVSSCSSSPYKEDTQIFKQYLESCVQKIVPKDTTYFVVISEYGCEGCIGKTISSLKDNPKALFIVNENTYYQYIQPKNVPPERYVIDSTNTIKRLKFHRHNVGIVQTANFEIYNIAYIEYNNADSALARIE